jgi:hypothetical protein
MMKKGHDFRDHICPDGIDKVKDFLKLGGPHCRYVPEGLLLVKSRTTL